MSERGLWDGPRDIAGALLLFHLLIFVGLTALARGVHLPWETLVILPGLAWLVVLSVFDRPMICIPPILTLVAFLFAFARTRPGWPRITTMTGSLLIWPVGFLVLAGYFYSTAD